MLFYNQDAAGPRLVPERTRRDEEQRGYGREDSRNGVDAVALAEHHRPTVASEKRTEAGRLPGLLVLRGTGYGASVPVIRPSRVGEIVSRAST